MISPPPDHVMDVVAAVASITQLAAYSQAAGQALTRLYKELHEGPSLWQEKKSSLQHILAVVKRISSTSPKAQQEASEQIVALVFDLNKTAVRALNIIAKAKSPGFLGVRWSSVGSSRDLSDIFEALRAKAEILQLVLSGEIFTNTVGQNIISDSERKSKKDARPKMASGGNPKTVTSEGVHVGSDASAACQNGLAEGAQEVKLGDTSVGDRSAAQSNNSTALNHGTWSEQLGIMKERGGNTEGDGDKKGNAATVFKGTGHTLGANQS